MRHLFVFIAVVLLAGTVHAQVSFNLGLNLDRQPIWGPTGYDHVENYYLPDIDAYYDVSQQRFFYSEGGHWKSGSSLPSRYRGYDLYNSYKVVVNEPAPYLHDKAYRDKYSSYKGRHDQQPIRDSRDSKYFANPNHPEHNNWVKRQKNDNGHGGEDGRDNKPERK